MTKSYNLRDAALIAADALPNAASTTVNGTILDLGEALTANGARLAPCELLLSAPVLDGTALPNTKTMTYNIQAGAIANCSDAVTFATITQTGVATNGAAAATLRVKLPSNCPRYVRSQAVSGANTADASAANMSLGLLF